MTYGIHPLGTFSVGHDTFSLYRLDIGLATETDAALALAAVQSRPVGMATDTEAALALAAVQAITAGMSLEIDAGMSLAGLQARGVGRSDEVDAALGLLPGGSGTGATAAEIWSYVMTNGQTAEANVVAIRALLEALTVPTAVEVANAVWAKELP